MASRRRIISEELEEEDASDVDMSLESEDGEDIEVSHQKTRTNRDNDGELEDEEDEEENEASDLDELSPTPPRDVPTPQRRLKIKLKLPQQNPSAVATPASSHRQEDEDEDEIESEDPDSDMEASTRSASVAGGKMTARQAVLANVVGSSHVSLNEPANARKKKPLTEIELALKREETARKRKNLSEKKLEDEKAETINRLLKKQSRSRSKRNALSTAEDRTPLEGDVVEETIEIPQLQTVPTMYRWISSSRTRPVFEDDMQTDEPPKGMTLSFSVPLVALSQ